MVAAGRRGAAAEPFRFALDEFEPVWSAWLSWIEPGGFIVSHIDAGPHRERWQIPITTAGTLNDVTAVDGFPFRVTHWEPHEVTNDTDRPRIHLVLDRDVIIRPAPARFSICKET